MTTGQRLNGILCALALWVLASVVSLPAWGLGEEPRPGAETVTQYLEPELLRLVFPGADRVG